MAGSTPLAELLAKAVPRPAHLAATDGGPVLSLALHCLMIEDGFELADAGNVGRPEMRFVPHKDWNGMYLDQWIFEYRRPGKANKFLLHCSLQARTKRMFIQASEENNPANVCVLGLQLDNYVPDPAALRSGWTATAATAAGGDSSSGNSSGGVVVNEAKMRSLFSEYILQPLMAHAEDEQAQHPDDEDADGGELGGVGGLGAWAWMVGAGPAPPPAQQAAQRRRLTVALGAVAVAAVAVMVAQRWRQRGA